MTLPPDGAPLLEAIGLPEIAARGISADVLRLDRMHPVISGNKWFKLKYHLREATSKTGPLITFGGAWSNHLIATARAAKQSGLAAIGFVRGEAPRTLSETLTAAREDGMQLEFISRKQYAAKNDAAFVERLRSRFPGAYIIPEGGSGLPGIRGCGEILQTIDSSGYTHILCAVGTGTMFLGLARAALPGQTVIGVPVLKGIDPLYLPGRDSLTPDQLSRSRLLDGYHFGGYARHPGELLNFMNEFFSRTGIPSDIVYTGKLFHAFWDGLAKGLFPSPARLLLIHSGGLQGNQSLPPGTLMF